MKCKYCNGTFYKKNKPVLCPCKSFCYKCENNEGFIIKPYSLCDYCAGTGYEKIFLQVVCVKRKTI